MNAWLTRMLVRILERIQPEGITVDVIFEYRNPARYGAAKHGKRAA